MPLVNLGLTKGQTRSKSLQNNIHGFISNPISLEIFSTFDSQWALETQILIRMLEWFETNSIAKIIKFSFQRLFMGQNRS